MVLEHLIGNIYVAARITANVLLYFDLTVISVHYPAIRLTHI